MPWADLFREAMLWGDLFAIIRLSLRPNRMRQVSGIVASLNTFVYNVLNFLYVQDLVLASKMRIKKMGRRQNLINVKKIN